MQAANQAKLLIFKTGIVTQSDVQKITAVFKTQGQIEQWSVDLNDCDKVLRIFTPLLDASYIIELLNQQGYLCVELD